MLIIWDCDGVLVDSEAHVNAIFVKELAKLGIHMDYDQSLEEFTGLTAKQAYEILGKRRNKAFTIQEMETIQKAIHQELAHKVQAIEGVFGVLQLLQQKNVTFCLASNGEPHHIHTSLTASGLLSFFKPKTIFSSSMVTKGKPSPDLFLYAARSMNMHPDNCLVIEDSVAGIQAAKAAGMRYIVFLGAQHGQKDWYRKKIMAETPLHICEDMKVLTSLLQVKLSLGADLS